MKAGWTLAAWSSFCLEARDADEILRAFSCDHERFGERFGAFVARAVDGLVKHGYNFRDANELLALCMMPKTAECVDCYRTFKFELLIECGECLFCPGCDAGKLYAPVVQRALRRMRVEACRDRNELAWRVAHAAMTFHWDDSYESNSARRLAWAILVDDEEAQESNALWLVDAEKAMEAAMARINAPPPAPEPVLERLGADAKVPAIETDRCGACGEEVPAEDLDVVDDSEQAVCLPCMARIADELTEIIDARRDAWIEAMEAQAEQVQQEPWPPSSRLVWEVDPEEWVAIDARPRNDLHDPGEAA